ncbi:MAG: hypothetical protein KKF89_04375 [Nanoarchaeota archaeon]|nr:hypothetical protein [Nanoarchaeota archaeon]
MEIDFEVKSNKEFREIMMKFNNLFGEIIKDYFVLNIYEIHKYNSLPMEKL